jgi:hypothetical protein
LHGSKSLAGGRHEVWQLGGERRKCAERSFQDQPGLGTDQPDQVAVTGWHSDVLTLVFEAIFARRPDTSHTW